MFFTYYFLPVVYTLRKRQQMPPKGEKAYPKIATKRGHFA
jgi:hypothetical protein